MARRRETYVGEWLPEPLLVTHDVAEDVELAESVSFALLTVLETLGPTERAVFVLREVFDVPYDEIAAAVDKSPAAVRQVAHRAREHVAARRPRMQVGRTEQQQVVQRFLDALTGGDLQGLMDVLAPDVVVVSDGGGLAQASLYPIEGVPCRPAARQVPQAHSRRRRRVPTWVNGAPALRMDIGRRPRHRDELRDRGRPHHPHLRHPQPGEAHRGSRRRRR